MKRFFIAVATIILVASCSNGPKMITPTSTEFTSGELAKYVEVVDQPAELSYAEKKGGFSTQYIRLKVTLKMKKNGFSGIDAQDIDFCGLFSVAIINLVDKDGFDVQELNIKSEERLKLKKLLTGRKGDTAKIVFEGEFNSDNAPKWFKDAAQFTPYLTADIQH